MQNPSRKERKKDFEIGAIKISGFEILLRYKNITRK